MKNFAKRAAALLLAVVLTFSLAGCYNENMSWAAKCGDDTLPIGSYIYYLSTSYNEAASRIDTETKVLKSELDGKDAETWIRDRAMKYVNQYFFIEQEMDRLGLEMTEADYEEAMLNTTNYWTYFGTIFEDYGVAQSSFDVAYSQYNVKYLKIFKALYGEGGEREIPEADLIDEYVSTYYNYEYFLVPLTTTAEDGTSADMTEDEKAELKKRLEATKKKIEKDDMTVNEAANEYDKERAGATSTYQLGLGTKETMESNYMPESFVTAITSMKSGEVSVFEASGYMVLAKLLPIEETVEIILSDPESRVNLMITLKAEEFGEYIISTAAELEGIELNEKAIAKYKPSMFTEGDGNGVMTPETETETEAE